MSEPVDAKSSGVEPSCAEPACAEPSSHTSLEVEQSQHRQTTGWMTVSVISGLFLLNVGIFLGEGFSSQSIRWLRFYADARHWPGWYAVNLWLIFAAMATFPRHRRVGFVCLAAIFCVTAIWSDLCAAPRAWLAGSVLTAVLGVYQTFYVPWISGPMTEWMATGTLSWRLVITPLLALFIIVWILCFNQRIIKNGELKDE